MPNLSSGEYAYKVQEGYLHDNVNAMLDAYEHFQRSHCYNPLRVLINSSHSGSSMFLNVDCGKCYHCRETKINSWVTRMYAHSEDYPYVYFVTLTYRPFYSLGDVSTLVFNKLSGALWHYDNFNSSHRYGWNPCILQKRHYQTFLKRLRKNTSVDITYVVCGEMGHDYGRPHFHFVLFAKSPLSQKDIERAWSISLWHDTANNKWSYFRNQKYHGKRYNFLIGRVQFDDLVENGSFNQKDIFVDGQNLNARNCFAYVCKYVCKGGDFNTKRIDIAYNSLYERKLISKSYDDFWQFYCHLSDSDRRAYIFDKHLKFINRYSTNFKINYYEICNKNESSLYLRGVNLSLFPKVKRDFVSSFGQFVEVSRGCPIGSIYAATHINEFVRGVFSKPILQDEGFVIPSYFRRKCEEKVYGLRRRTQSVSSRSFVLSNLPLMLEHFEKVYRGEDSFRFCSPVDLFRTRDDAFRYSNEIFKDVWSGELIYFPKYHGYIHAEYYKYNRSLRKYELRRITSLHEFLRVYIPKLRESIRRYESAVLIGSQNEVLQNRAAILLEEYGFTLRNLRLRFADKQDKYLKFRDTTYHSTHLSVE